MTDLEVISSGMGGVESVLRAEIATCTYCAADLPAGPGPVVQFSSAARILIIGQAPGSRVHASGIPWVDPSGDRLREWTGLSKRDFYDPAKVAMMAMGFCYPGKGQNGDLPPRAECAPRWHERILALLPADRLTLLVGRLCASALLAAGGGRLAHREGSSVPIFRSGVLAVASPIVAQRHLDEAQSVVRERGSARLARSGAGAALLKQQGSLSRRLLR
jgi:uracil-DNA glycosylase